MFENDLKPRLHSPVGKQNGKKDLGKGLSLWDVNIKLMKRILNVLIALALHDKLFTTRSFNSSPLYCTIVLLIV
jgi:hypothetical protein